MSRDEDYYYYEEEMAREEFINEIIENARAEIIDEARDGIVENFRSERLSSFYNTHQDLGYPATLSLKEARELIEINSTASFIMGFAASEYTLKKILLEPIAAGLVHDEPLSTIIAPLVMSDKNFIGILSEILVSLDIDLKAETIGDDKRNLWSEWHRQKGIRNGAVHRCETVSAEDAVLSILLAEHLIESIFPRLKTKLGLE